MANNDPSTIDIGAMTRRAVADVAAQTPPKPVAPSAAQVRATEERIGEWLPPGAHQSLPASKS